MQENVEYMEFFGVVFSRLGEGKIVTVVKAFALELDRFVSDHDLPRMLAL